MMGDMADVFSDMRAASQQKRRDNTAHSTEMLKAAGVQFVSPNGGAHLIVTHGKHTVDFWPSTGLWIPRGTKNLKRRGIRPLLSYLGASEPRGLFHLLLSEDL